MSNPRLSAKERGLLKGAIRRVFSRSDLRRQAVERTVVHGYTDPERPRVKRWSLCSYCHKMTPTYQIECDHVDPIVPVDRSLETMSWDEVIDRVWCDPSNLRGSCQACHKLKSALENKQRRAAKKASGKP